MCKSMLIHTFILVRVCIVSPLHVQGETEKKVPLNMQRNEDQNDQQTSPSTALMNELNAIDDSVEEVCVVHTYAYIHMCLHVHTFLQSYKRAYPNPLTPKRFNRVQRTVNTSAGGEENESTVENSPTYRTRKSELWVQQLRSICVCICSFDCTCMCMSNVSFNSSGQHHRNHPHREHPQVLYIHVNMYVYTYLYICMFNRLGWKGHDVSHISSVNDDSHGYVTNGNSYNKFHLPLTLGHGNTRRYVAIHIQHN